MRPGLAVRERRRALAVREGRREGGGSGPREGREVLRLPWDRRVDFAYFFKKYTELSYYCSE